MSNDIPDFMREFDTDVDYGFTPVSKKPAEDTKEPACLLYTSPSPRDFVRSRMPSSA